MASSPYSVTGTLAHSASLGRQVAKIERDHEMLVRLLTSVICDDRGALQAWCEDYNLRCDLDFPDRLELLQHGLAIAMRQP